MCSWKAAVELVEDVHKTAPLSEYGGESMATWVRVPQGPGEYLVRSPNFAGAYREIEFLENDRVRVFYNHVGSSYCIPLAAYLTYVMDAEFRRIETIRL
jgi:hypothetical protein